MINVALIDDHSLIRNALAELINNFEGYQVTLQAANGAEFIELLHIHPLPDIVFVDIQMPIMNGYDTAQILSAKFPDIKIMALSVEDDEESILKMLRCGSKGYLLKDTPINEFKLALDELYSKGYYHSDLVANSLLNAIHPSKISFTKVIFQAREEEFLKLACSELTYKEIADQMCLSPRTVDGYRENLFLKLEVKSRVGLVLFAIKNGLVHF